jgi:ubiquinone/menaquinone biosynthesis C-methylase UbiE
VTAVTAIVGGGVGYALLRAPDPLADFYASTEKVLGMRFGQNRAKALVQDIRREYKALTPGVPSIGGEENVFTMGIMQAVFKQFRKPTGWMAGLAGLGMNRGHEKVWRWGLEHTTIAPDAVILDVGCGGGGAVKILAQVTPRGKVCGVDYSEDVLRTARRVNRALIVQGRVEFEHGSVSDLPLPDNRFDLATAFETTIFWPSLVDDLREVLRVLKPGGTLLIANEAYRDARFEERNARWAQLTGFQPLQTPQETRQCLIEAGYTRVEVDTLPEKNWIAVTAQKSR